jgi:hypothetical protein
MYQRDKNLAKDERAAFITVYHGKEHHSSIRRLPSREKYFLALIDNRNATLTAVADLS